MSFLRIKAAITGLFIFVVFPVSAFEVDPRTRGSMRSLNQIFPGLTREQRGRVFSETGLRNNFRANETPLIIPSPNSGINVLGAVMEKTPTQLVETLVVIPYNRRILTKLDAYNAIGRIGNISDYLVYSAARDSFIPIFDRSTRLDNGRRNRPIPDPPPATVLPSSESIFLLLRDTVFGNTYFRGDFSDGRYGITYNMTNNTAVWFLIFPVMGAEKFAAVLYLEPLREGMLVYGMAGIDIPEFLVSRINLAFQIDRRLSLLINWLRDGLVSTN
jgi:hypothetical protein